MKCESFNFYFLSGSNITFFILVLTNLREASLVIRLLSQFTSSGDINLEDFSLVTPCHG